MDHFLINQLAALTSSVQSQAVSTSRHYLANSFVPLHGQVIQAAASASSSAYLDINNTHFSAYRKSASAPEYTLSMAAIPPL
ncbi:uncharacterized protein BO95DRAFT_163548 [Aspergillus brunneoviolaceus CBS 621.78]|uniref:Uncharacterized protein n=1 Tax=Aspergillus brunneoviolaceus CBS 621.78 TaxID=1450534 RepID=A0ACD1G6U8_9EURO|nr:hypothetical protein BO95DRAFT_163548 [Aspergillus brunneoviolaceus CBS 621.78]RAH44963.1 hypothetical protein BO95DRAFT_163548 [Aspergillus brunneoviolaceus CBS 621.78]